jgi:hypothetical protein
LVLILLIGTDLLSQVPQDKPPKTAPDRPVEQPSSEPDHCRETEEEGQREGGRKGGREEERSEAGSRALVNNPPLYVISKRQCRFRAAIGRPNGSRAEGEGSQPGEKVIYVPRRESNTKEEGSQAGFSPHLDKLK